MCSAVSILKYTEEQKQLAALARQMAMHRNVLYHGTRYAQSILRTGVLFASDPGLPTVSLTRSPEVAAYFALLPRDDCEDCGAILIFDRERIRRRYRIYAIEGEVIIYYRHNEAEEEVWGDIIDVSKYLVGFVSMPGRLYPEKLKALNRKRRTQIDARLDDLLNFAPDWRFGPEDMINLNMKKREVAREALLKGIGIARVAEEVGLSLNTVRRLAGNLCQRSNPGA
jgi:hypothetical protein